MTRDDMNRRDFAQTRSSNDGDGTTDHDVHSTEIDPQRLAALLDGRLTGQERDELVALIAASEEHAALLADVASALGEVEGPRAATPARRAWWRTSAAWIAVAAGLIAVVAVPIVRRARGRSGADLTDFALALSNHEAGLPGDWTPPRWSATRGEGASLSDAARSTRLGAGFIELALRLSAHDTAAAGTARAMAVLLRDIPAGGAAARVLDDVADSAAARVWNVGDELREARTGAASLAQSDYMALGAWSEAARVAALRGDAAFFHTAATRRALERINVLAGRDPRLKQAVDRVSGEVARSAVGADLENSLAKLLALAGS